MPVRSVVILLVVAAPAMGLVTYSSNAGVKVRPDSEPSREADAISLDARGATKQSLQTLTSATPSEVNHVHHHYHYYNNNSAQNNGPTTPSTDANSNFCADPGDGSARVWYVCKGKKFKAQTEAEVPLGIKVANEMCCTREVDAACLCCLDFARPLKYDRCGTVMLDAAQRQPETPGGMTVDDPAEDETVIVCTEDKAVAKLAEEQSNGTHIVPTHCLAREFAPEELTGSPEFGTAPGEIVLDERLRFLKAQGIPAPLPTCRDTLRSSAGGTCPAGTPKAGQMPNSASAKVIAEVKGNVGFMSIGRGNTATFRSYLGKGI